MEIREIDPNDPIFQNIRNEGVPGKLSFNKHLPSFLQKKEQTNYQPSVRTEYVQPAPPKPVPAPQPTIPVGSTPIMVPFQAPRNATLPQVKVKVPQAPMPEPVISAPVKKRVVVHNPVPLPKETLVLDDDLEDMIRAGPPYIREPVVEEQRAIAGNMASPQMMITPVPVPAQQPMATADLDVAEIYGTGHGINLPKFKMPSFRREKKEPAYDPNMVREVTRPAFNWRGLIPLIAQVAGGIVMVFLGLTATGSYYQPATRYAGQLATVFYQYQLGVLVVVIGCLIAYRAFQKAGKL